jgi:peptidoglycan/xylan/chitin deacetylase (PgdA/CDA1 family)
MKLMQCWDDGVTSDVRLVSLLRRYGAHATFNLNAGLHARERQFGWHHQGTEVWRLGRDELRQVYAGFNVANHSLTHPHPEQLPIESARREIQEGRAHLQDLFDQPVSGFVYPFGSFDDGVRQAVRDAGHIYARTTRAAGAGWSATPCGTRSRRPWRACAPSLACNGVTPPTSSLETRHDFNAVCASAGSAVRRL